MPNISSTVGVLPQHSRPDVADTDPNDEREVAAEPGRLYLPQQRSGPAAGEEATTKDTEGAHNNDVSRPES